MIRKVKSIVLIGWLAVGYSAFSRISLSTSLANILLPPPSRQTFLDARHRWQDQAFAHYRFVYIETRNSCAYQVEVSHERVIEATPIKNTRSAPIKTDPSNQKSCPELPASRFRTISEFFKEIEPYATTWICGPNGCWCDRIELRVTYHPRLGYPESVKIWQGEPTGWQWEEYSRRRGDGDHFCTLMGFIEGTQFEVRDVEVLGQ